MISYLFILYVFIDEAVVFIPECKCRSKGTVWLKLVSGHVFCKCFLGGFLKAILD